MSERNGSVDSFNEFFSSSKVNNDDNDKKPKQSDAPATSVVAALIKSQPVLHHRRKSSETKLITNSKKMPLTTDVKNTPAKSKRIDSPLSKTYESDFDDNISIDEKENNSSLPAPKERLPETPRHASDSKLKPSYKITNHNTKRKEKLLPHIRPKNRTKRLRKETKSEVEQRILSAQNDQLNQLQSRLAELRRQLEEERIENKTLRIIQKREERALEKYEDQECDVLKVARDYTHEIEHIQEKITNERENKIKLEKEVEDRNEILRDQTKRMRFYEKLVHEENLDEPDDLREKLKETDKKLKKYQEKIANKEKYIENLEKTYRHEIREELSKQRDLKHEIESHSKKYTDLLLRFEEKTRQVGTMHIYIQRGGRRPSISSSMNLSKTRSYQSLEDTSPRFREKIQEYDKKRRDEVKLKPKPKPLPLPDNSPPKRERKKYVPSIVLKPKAKKPPPIPPVPDEKPPIIETEHVRQKGIPPVRRLSTPKSIDEDKSEIEDEIIIEPIHQKPPSPPPPPPIQTRTIQRREQHLSQAPVHKRPLTPVSPPIETKSSNDGSTKSSLFKYTEPPPPPPAKPPVTREFDDKWLDIFDTNKKEESIKDDHLSKLISDEQQERKIVTTTKPSPPSSQRPSMIMFEPSSISTNGNQKKPPTRITTSNVYDFEQAIVNLHEGKPVTAQSTTATTPVDPFESLFGQNTTKSTNRMNTRDDTFTTSQNKSDPFDSLFTESSSAANTSTTIKPNSRPIPTQNDKLQRPKVVTNAPKSVPNRTVVEEIEEFVL